MNLSQNSLFKADASVRPVAESGILGLVLVLGKKNTFFFPLMEERSKWVVNFQGRGNDLVHLDP
jgi:hypothetical protein